MRILIIVALALSAGTAAAEIYSWKDADGKIHYSDKPPADTPPSLKTVPLPANNPSSAGQPRPTTPASRKPDDSTEKGKAAAQNSLAACEKAKASMQEFLDRPRRTAVGKGGKFHALDGEERAQEEAQLQKAIDTACK